MITSKEKQKILKLKYRAVVERVMWRFISNMKIDDTPTKFKGDPLYEAEEMECWTRTLQQVAKNYKKTFDRLPFDLRYQEKE